MEATLRDWTEPARFVAMLMGSLAGVALLLASIGYLRGDRVHGESACA